MDTGMRQDFKKLFDGIDEASRALRDADDAIAMAQQLQRAAIQKALDANRAAISLLNRLTDDQAST